MRRKGKGEKRAGQCFQAKVRERKTSGGERGEDFFFKRRGKNNVSEKKEKMAIEKRTENLMKRKGERCFLLLR